MNAVAAEESAEARVYGGMQRWLTLALLSLAFFFSLLDRQILTVLIDPVRADLALSDTQFGLLQGLAFAVFYVIFALPVARVADRWNRKAVIAGGLFLWSASTCLAGFARSFGALFGARVGVGVGEACLAPAAYSTLADLFHPRSLGRIIGVFHAVGAFGIAGSVAIGGALYERFAAAGPNSLFGQPVPAWGMVLVAVGLPGIVLSILIALCVREPQRLAREQNKSASWSDLREALIAQRFAFVRLVVGGSVLAIAGNALLTWAPAYLMRTFELSPAQAGPRLGISFGIGAIVGPLLGGLLSDRLFKRYGNAGPIAALVIFSGATVLSFLTLLLVEGPLAATSVIALVSICYSAVLAVAATAIQLQAPVQLRAQISALSLCLNTVIGLGLGSLLVGVLTDRVFGTSGVGIALAIVAIASSIVGGALIGTLLRKGTPPAV